MHEMNTCAVRGMPVPGAMCGKVIVGGKFCGHDGTCEHKRVEHCNEAWCFIGSGNANSNLDAAIDAATLAAKEGGAA